MDKKKFLSLLVFLALVSAIALIGSFPTDESHTIWYENLLKPSWNPPKWLFAPVWSILYLMIAVAGWLYYIANASSYRSKTLFYYFIQLAFNLTWPYLFFSLKSPGFGLINICFMSLFIAMTIYQGMKVSKVASFLLVPYLIWTIYALSLNAAIFYLN